MPLKPMVRAILLIKDVMLVKINRNIKIRNQTI